MQRKDFSKSLAALALGLGVAVAGAGMTACQRGDVSLFAADAHASTLAVPAAAPTAQAGQPDRQLGPMPSLSPLVKQLRPVVVNISTMVKAKTVFRKGRNFGRQQQPRQRPFNQDEGDEDQ